MGIHFYTGLILLIGLALAPKLVLGYLLAGTLLGLCYLLFSPNPVRATPIGSVPIQFSRTDDAGFLVFMACYWGPVMTVILIIALAMCTLGETVMWDYPDRHERDV